MNHMLKWSYFGHTELYKILKLISPLSFYLPNMATRKLKIMHGAHVLFVLDSVVQSVFFFKVVLWHSVSKRATVISNTSS